jgi:hypothetical protein
VVRIVRARRRVRVRLAHLASDPTTGESLASYFPPFSGRQIDDPQETESLRLVRSGNVVRGY